MAEETTINGGKSEDAMAIKGADSEDRVVNIAGDETVESEPKLGELSMKIAALEEENKQLIHPSIEKLKDEIKKSKETVNKSNSGNEDLKSKIVKLEDETRSLHNKVSDLKEKVEESLEMANKSNSENENLKIGFVKLADENKCLIKEQMNQFINDWQTEKGTLYVKQEELATLHRSIKELQRQSDQKTKVIWLVTAVSLAVVSTVGVVSHLYAKRK